MTTATITEKACTGCGVKRPLADYHRKAANRDGYNTQCKACRSAYQQTYREANRDEITAQKKAWREANREHYLARRKAYYEANREVLLARAKDYYEANRVEISTRVSQYHAERWATDPEYRDQRRAEKTRRYRLLASAKQEPYTRQEIFQRDGWVCGICDEPIDPQVRWPDPACATVDHIVPLSRGGDDTPANVQAAHGSCNYGKCDRVEDEDRAVAA